MSELNLEEGTELSLDFQKLNSLSDQNLVPVVVQDANTKEVLILAYANRQALVETLSTKKATFWSSSRNELWVKGASSGNTLRLIELRVNCEQNSLLYLVEPEGTGACHSKNQDGEYRKTCYYRHIEGDHLQFTDES